MAPRRKVSVEKAVAVVERFIDHFRTNLLPKWSDNVWSEMSKALEGAWSAECAYLNVRCNRGDILTIARKNQGIIVQEQLAADHLKNASENSFSEDSSNNNISASSITSADNHNTTIMNMVLTEDEWNTIKPTDTDEKPKLKRGIWTNVLSDALWLQYRMPCAFMFKRSVVLKSQSDQSYHIKFDGKCKSTKCSNTIKGSAEKNINEKGITFALEMRDTRGEKHDVVKRPLNGKKRQDAYKSLMTEGCSNYRKHRAQQIMLPGDIEPPTLPKSHVLRHAKKEGNDKDLGIEKQSGRDIVRSIEEMPLSSQYSGLIHEVAGFPFRVVYGSPSQLRLYQEFRRLKKLDGAISLDATGSLVNKIQRHNGTKSSHIFLYAIVINFNGVTASVYQMLSERQDSITIMTWLFRWLQSGAAPPKQAVCDYSRALLMAMSMSFNRQPIKAYINDRFIAITNSTEITKQPVTLIRIDVAHFVHMICRWKSFQNVRQQAIKDFYIRCVALMIECRTKRNFERVFILTCAVAIQTHEDAVIDLAEAQTVKEVRKQLEHLIAKGTVTDDFKDYDSQNKRDIPFRPKFVDDQSDSDSEIDGENEDISIDKWIDGLIAKVQIPLLPGEDLNAFYLPDFINQFIGVAKEFPLWTAVGMPPDTQRATSSYIEGYFNDLKTRVFKNYRLPISVDKFIREHAKDIAAANCIISSTMVQYNNDRLHRNDCKPESNVLVQEIVEGAEKKAETEKKIQIEREIEINKKLEPAEDETVQDVSSHAEISVENNINGYHSDIFDCEGWGGFGDSFELNHNTKNADSGNAISEKLVSDNPVKVSTAIDSDSSAHSIYEDINNNTEKSEMYIHETFDHSYSKVSDDEPVTSSNVVLTLEKQVDFESIEERALEEHPRSKPTKPSKYFKAYPEILRQNDLITDKTTTKIKGAGLLRNGSVCGAVTLESLRYFVRNTCPFDSVVQILATAGTDDIDYRRVLQNTTNSTLKFVYNLITRGVSNDIFMERARILLNFCPQKCQGQIGKKVTSWEIDAWQNVSNVVSSTLSSNPSVTDIEDCFICGKRTVCRTLISPNHNIITRRGFKALQEALQFWSPLYKIKCQQGNCSGTFTRTSTTNEHVFIELDVRHSNDIKKTIQCTLDDFPTILRVQSGSQGICSEYRLAGIIERLPGHYVAHCLRSGGFWQKYNDMDRKVGVSGPRSRIEPHLAIYIAKSIRS